MFDGNIAHKIMSSVLAVVCKQARQREMVVGMEWMDGMDGMHWIGRNDTATIERPLTSTAIRPDGGEATAELRQVVQQQAAKTIRPMGSSGQMGKDQGMTD